MHCKYLLVGGLSFHSIWCICKLKVLILMLSIWNFLLCFFLVSFKMMPFTFKFMIHLVLIFVCEAVIVFISPPCGYSCLHTMYWINLCSPVICWTTSFSFSSYMHWSVSGSPFCATCSLLSLCVDATLS